MGDSTFHTIDLGVNFAYERYSRKKFEKILDKFMHSNNKLF